MAQVRLTKPLRLICTKDGSKTICEVDDKNPRSVTECWRDDVDAWEYELEYAIKDRVETLKLNDAVLFRRVNEDGEYVTKNGTIVNKDWTAKEAYVIDPMDLKVAKYD